MNYVEAEAKLQLKGRSRVKLQNNTYLERCESYLTDKSIAVRLHSTNIITFYPDGRIVVCNGGYPTITTHDRLNIYLSRPYRVYGEPVQNRRSDGGATVLSDGRGHECLIDSRATINADGSIDGGDVEAYRNERREERNASNRVRNRGRYWARKARGIYTDHSQCTARKSGVRYQCGTWGRWNRRQLTIGECKCGCRVYQKAPNYTDTVDSILQEENATVRTAKIVCYGLEKFFLDAQAKVVDEQAGYQLLSLPFTNWQQMKALKMTCPSTGAVYINTVPPAIEEVPTALDWMFDTEHYLETVTQQA